MPVRILIPTPLRIYTGNNEVFFAAGSTVEEVLNQFTFRYSQVKKYLYPEDGRLRKFVNVYVNSDDIRFLHGERTPVSDEDVISIIPSIAGG